LDRSTTTLLFIPGNSPGMLKNAPVFGADCLILDLEDSVTPAEKDAARILVRHALPWLKTQGTEVAVRINPFSEAFLGYEDMEEIALSPPDVIMLPKATKEEVQILSGLLDEIEKKKGLAETGIKIIPLVETAAAVVNMREIAGSSGRVAGLLLGAEDLTADLGVKRTRRGLEILYARSKMAMVCKAAGIAAIDTPFADIRDEAGLHYDAHTARALGMTGKAAIHPGQINVIRKAFTPDEEEIAYAARIISAMEEAEKESRGVLALDGRMLDAPAVAWAKQTLEKAKRATTW